MATATQPKTEDISALVDKAGELDADVEELKDKKEALEILRSAIEARMKLKPEGEGLAEGRKFAVVVGARGNEREITDMEKTLTLLGVTVTGKGRELFLQLITIGLGKLDAVLPKDLVAAVTKKEPTGGRRFKFIARRAA